MAENMWEKYREEREKNQSKSPKHGKQTNQKLKRKSQAMKKRSTN